MNESAAIEVQDVWKRFRVVTSSSSYGRLSEVVSGVGRRLIGRGRQPDAAAETFWALQAIAFTVPSGQAVGLIGHNGAGKSTLLKVVSRITRPTRGCIRVAGRVGSLLEVGTGFHPELTGRENIFVNGAVLGMTRRDVRRKLDEIVAFSEVERFLDTPVKRYSSGMKMRLAFAVAAHLDPEILLIDEVLAVGDAAFQRKCLGKMGEVAGTGRTILFVSHNMLAVRALCERAVWLDGGMVRDDGPAEEVADRYAASYDPGEMVRIWGDEAPAGDGLTLRRLSVESDDGRPLDVHSATAFEAKVTAAAACGDVVVGFLLKTAEQVPVWFARPPEGTSMPAGGSLRVRFRTPGGLLTDGRYALSAVVYRDGTREVLRADNAVTFDIREDPAARDGAFGRSTGVLRAVGEWNVQTG